ncbi:hypothetical protein CC85DRAFT_305809 [Cutaneotrichosporon oleaginosum]|uniref:N-acetyltransferase domain-containing protein n=1 Tax=Cutaneotrichosporon oleaginosum TaxID=879819 RepID=A0A0J0XC24_9TREE|nr:uncharacterized protein CC85DRAFT_305809 [Cutaneotrichosporon oleaginosum]KLT38610.1 hypothetical protein CC85DRAFT_305809 [Cutaneotrichosporon oleaginosum]TXT05809.1 hypothetical protein COLE_07129 [Cutaneotrichosporon oleaginosum]
MAVSVRHVKEADDRPWAGLWSADPAISRLVFTDAVSHAFANGWQVWVAEDTKILGVALWLPPGVDEGTEFFARGMKAMPEHLAVHALTVVVPEFMKLDSIVPGSKQAWWFLSFLGTHPDAQGRGVGSALMRAKMDAVDGPFALSTGTESNLAWYGHRGFVTRGSIKAPQHDGWLWEERYMTHPGDAVVDGGVKRQ